MKRFRACARIAAALALIAAGSCGDDDASSGKPIAKDAGGGGHADAGAEPSTGLPRPGLSRPPGKSLPPELRPPR
jgi:hypothetical protein